MKHQLTALTPCQPGLPSSTTHGEGCHGLDVVGTHTTTFCHWRHLRPTPPQRNVLEVIDPFHWTTADSVSVGGKERGGKFAKGLRKIPNWNMIRGDRTRDHFILALYFKRTQDVKLHAFLPSGAPTEKGQPRVRCANKNVPERHESCGGTSQEIKRNNWQELVQLLLFKLGNLLVPSQPTEYSHWHSACTRADLGLATIPGKSFCKIDKQHQATQRKEMERDWNDSTQGGWILI